MAEVYFENTKYRVLHKISDGASSQVYLVELDGKKYALKALKSVSDDSRARLRVEASTLARIQHINLVKIFDIGEANSLPYIVMEFVDGVSLQEKIQKHEQFDEKEIIHIISSIAEALAELHRNNLVHRDIKPANVLVTANHIKLIDLGLVGAVEQIKNEVAFVGAPLYCSPEQSKTLKRDVTFASDLYSVGILFYELFSGAPPFDGTLSEILQQHIATPVPNLNKDEILVRPGIVAIIEKLLAKEPGQRYQTCAGLLTDLSRLEEIESLLTTNKDPNLDKKNRNQVAVEIKFVERSLELAQIEESWLQIQSGDSGLFVVKGPSGAGKTRLCHEFIDRVSRKEGSYRLVLKGKGRMSDKDMPFAAIREAIDDFLEYLLQLPSDLREKVVTAVRAAGLGYEKNLIRLSGRLQKFLAVSSNQSVETDVEGEKEKFFESIRIFFTELSLRLNGIIFLIDDLQWLDPSSTDLIARLTKENHKNSTFFLATARSDEKSEIALKSVLTVIGTGLIGQIELTDFTKVQMDTLICDYLGTKQLDPSIVDLFYKRSNGNPLVAVEYLRALVEQGFLFYKDNRWAIRNDGTEKIVFSEDIYQLIVKRIEKCTAPLRAMLSHGAVLGTVFASAEMIEIAGIDTHQIGDILEEGMSLGLIEKLGTGKVKFTHDKISESIKQSMSDYDYQQISLKLLSHYRAKVEKTEDEIYILARLAISAGSGVELQYKFASNLSAGILAMSNFSHMQAYQFLSYAYGLTTTIDIKDKELVKLVTNLSICATMIGQWEIAESAIKKALELSKNDALELAECLTLNVWIKRCHGDNTTAWESFRKACSILGTPYPVHFHWKILNILWLFFLVVLFELTDIKVTQVPILRSLKKKSTEKLANLYFTVASVAEFQTYLDALTVSLKALVFGHLSGSQRDLAIGYSCTGYAWAGLGLKDLAMHFFSRGMIYSEASHDPVVKAICMGRRFEGRLHYGQFEDFKNGISPTDQLFLQKFLNPIDYGRTRSAWSFFLAFKGNNREAIEYIKSYCDPESQDTSRLPISSLLNGLHMSWLNLSIIGQLQDAQKIKKIVLKKNSNYRCVPPAHRFTASYELQARMQLEEYDELVVPLREYYQSRVLSRTDLLGRVYFSQTVFLDLLELENATTLEEIFSVRKRFKRNLQQVFLTLYDPTYRVNYYLLKAIYYRIIGKLNKAENWLKVCEDIASQSNHHRVLFQVLRERCRIYKAKGNQILTGLTLSAALQMAEQHQWLPDKSALLSEFEGILGSSEVDVMTSSYDIKRTSITSTISNHGTIGAVRRSNVAQESHGTFGNESIVDSRSGFSTNDIRLFDALLKVSEAFISTADLVEQTKTVLFEIMKVFGAERGFVFLLDEKSSNYSIFSAKNSDGLDLQHSIGYSSTVVKKVIQTVNPVLVVNTEEAEVLGSQSAILYNLRSIIATPLRIKDKILGVIYLDSSLVKGLFSKDDLHLFKTLSNHISHAHELSRAAKVELEKANLAAQLKVQEVIAVEAKKVQVLIDNIQQAIFSISSDGTIVEPISKHSETIFNRKIVGRNLIDTIYKDQIKSENISQFASALSSVFGEDELQWDLTTDLFPRKINYQIDTKTDAKTEKILQIQLSPIWDQQQKLEKILCVIDDVTTLEELEKRVNEKGLQTAVLSEILEGDFHTLKKFIQESFRDIKKLNLSMNDQSMQQLPITLRSLHTLKGNARLYGLRTLSGEVHSVESQVLELNNKVKAGVFGKSEIQLGFDKLIKCVQMYQETLEKFSSSVLSSRDHEVNLNALNDLLRILKVLQRKIPSDDSSKINVAMERLYYKSIKELILTFNPMIKDLASQLNKKIDLEVKGDVLLSEQTTSLLRDILVHLLRNSIDHGLETPSERLTAGKSEIGHIIIECLDNEYDTTISIQDDGRGMDPKIILEKAIKKGVISEVDAKNIKENERLNLIFASGFSTKDHATDVSGRGVGLDVVKENINVINGNIKINTKPGVGTEFIINLSKDSRVQTLRQPS